MKKKVFVVVIDQMFDCDRVLDSVDVFDTEEKARAKYNEFVEKEKKWIEDEGREDWEVQETENSFDAFEDGYYAQNHSYARIEEKEIQ